MRGKKKIKKTGQHGFFQWQTLLVASAFLGFFVFAGYICGNIATPYRIPDTNSDAYHQSETAFLIFFIVGSIVSLLLALFSAYMCDHPTLLKDKFSKLFRKSADTADADAADEIAQTAGRGAVAADVFRLDDAEHCSVSEDNAAELSVSDSPKQEPSVSDSPKQELLVSDSPKQELSGSERSACPSVFEDTTAAASKSYPLAEETPVSEGSAQDSTGNNPQS